MRGFIHFNRKLSKLFDEKFFRSYMKDGNRTFIDDVFPNFLNREETVFDIGGGSQPIVSEKIKSDFDLSVIGIDIDEDELNNSPDNVYDEKICADISQFDDIENAADLVICQSTLEHVHDNKAAVRNISKMMKVNREVIIFVPCRNAMFARLNLWLPQRLKEKLLYSIFPETEEHQGFPVYYNLCTPDEMSAEFEKNGVSTKITCFWMSAYFSFFFPLYFIWRLYTAVARRKLGHNYCETFILIGRKFDDQ